MRFKFRLPKIAWDLRAHSPALLKKLEKDHPAAARVYASLKKRWPVPSTQEPFKAGAAFRLQGHGRAFCVSGKFPGVVAVKGTEFLAADLPRALDRMGRRKGPMLETSLESFPLNEGKVPMALLADEAFAEAQRASEFQAAHLAAYGQTARVPLPLLVCRWSASDAAALEAALRPRLSERAGAAVRALLRGGLASYAYYYPAVPMRVRHIARQLRPMESRGFARRAARLRRWGRLYVPDFEPVTAVRRWCALAARMMALGYFPCSLAHRQTGQCVDEQNAVIDGGFADLDSLQPMAALLDDHDFQETFLLSWSNLSHTVKRFLAGYLDEPSPSAAVQALIHAHVLALFKNAFREEERRGRRFDRRLRAAAAGADPADELGRALAALFP